MFGHLTFRITFLVITVVTFIIHNCLGKRLDLDYDTFLHMTSNRYHKNGMILFYHPWCGQCRAMLPAYDKLMEYYSGSSSVFITRINCTDQKELCDDHAVHHFPIVVVYYKINPSSSSSLGGPKKVQEEVYRGGKAFEDLLDFVDEKLVTKCTIHNNQKKEDHDCNEKVLQYMKKWMDRPITNLQQEIQRLNTILFDTTITVEIKIWIRERLSILHQLLLISKESNEL